MDQLLHIVLGTALLAALANADGGHFGSRGLHIGRGTGGLIGSFSNGKGKGILEGIGHFDESKFGGGFFTKGFGGGAATGFAGHGFGDAQLGKGVGKLGGAGLVTSAKAESAIGSGFGLGAGKFGGSQLGLGHHGAAPLDVGPHGAGQAVSGHLGAGHLGAGSLGAGHLGAGHLGAGSLGAGHLGAASVGGGVGKGAALGAGKLGAGAAVKGGPAVGAVGLGGAGAKLAGGAGAAGHHLAGPPTIIAGLGGGKPQTVTATTNLGASVKGGRFDIGKLGNSLVDEALSKIHGGQVANSFWKGGELHTTIVVEEELGKESQFGPADLKGSIGADPVAEVGIEAQKVGPGAGAVLGHGVGIGLGHGAGVGLGHGAGAGLGHGAGAVLGHGGGAVLDHGAGVGFGHGAGAGLAHGAGAGLGHEAGAGLGHGAGASLGHGAGAVLDHGVGAGLGHGAGAGLGHGAGAVLDHGAGPALSAVHSSAAVGGLGKYSGDDLALSSHPSLAGHGKIHSESLKVIDSGTIIGGNVFRGSGGKSAGLSSGLGIHGKGVSSLGEIGSSLGFSSLKGPTIVKGKGVHLPGKSLGHGGSLASEKGAAGATLLSPLKVVHGGRFGGLSGVSHVVTHKGPGASGFVRHGASVLEEGLGGAGGFGKHGGESLAGLGSGSLGHLGLGGSKGIGATSFVRHSSIGSSLGKHYG